MNSFDLRCEDVTCMYVCMYACIASYVCSYVAIYTTDVMIVTSAVRLMVILTVVQLLNCGGYGKSKFH